MIEEEITATIRKLKNRKLLGVDDVPAELIREERLEVGKRFTELCQNILKTKTFPREWTKSLKIPLPMKGNLKLCQNDRTMSFVS